MQVSPHTTTGEENNDVRPGHMPQPHLTEDVDEHGNPVLHKADMEGGEAENATDEDTPGNGSSGSSPEEKDITD